MFRVPFRRVGAIRRTLPIAVVTAFLAIALLGVLSPTATAATPPPYFGSAVQIDRPPAYNGGSPSLAMGSDGDAYLAFAAWGGSTTQTDIFFTKSSDGRTWTVPVRVNDDAGSTGQSDPSIALDSANRIYIVWTDQRNGNTDVFFSKSTDGGRTFTLNVRGNDITTNSQSEPDLAVDHVDPDIVHIVWTDTRSAVSGPDIYYANSTDGGLTFNPSLRVNTDVSGAEQGVPAVAVAPDRSVQVVWRDPRNAAKGTDIYFAKSTDLGATWDPFVIVNNDPGSAAQTDPAIDVNVTGTIFIAWMDSRDTSTGSDIFATRSTNGGTSFAASVKVNDDRSAVPQAQPSLDANGEKVQVAWTDYRNGGFWPYDVYSASSVDGLAWSENIRVNGETGRNFQSNPTVGLDAAGDAFAAWVDSSVVPVFPFVQQSVLAAALDVVSPTSRAGPAITIDQGNAASFDGSGSSDNLAIDSYYWDFGDGSGTTGMAGTHTYAAAGVYNVYLTVWDFSGNTATSSLTLTVRDTEAPVPRGGGDRSVDEGQPLFFDSSASTDNVGVEAYAWEFGDGSSATTATASHVYARPGTYTATLTVTDGAGNSATQTFTVTVRPSALAGLVQLLELIVAILAIALAVLGWIVLRMRRRQPRSTAARSAPPPAQPPVEPPREPDFLDMPLPPPKEP